VQSDQPTERSGAPGRLSLDFKVGAVLMAIVLVAAVVVLALTEPKGGTTTATVPTTTVVTKTVADRALRRDVAALRARAAKADASRAKVQASLKALAARVDALEAALGRVRSRPSGTKPLRTKLASLGAQLKTANRCLFQLQKQLDDLQAYALTRQALHKRVSGACVGILEPRFAGE
jgi:septal ring factor EnvC (AmiA/AmiB activator)